MRAQPALLIILLAAGAWPRGLAAADAAMPPADVRAIRELQSRGAGTALLPADAPKPEALLALADLGAAAANPDEQGLQAQDYDALLALLQRYRDDLLKLGMDGDELAAQLRALDARESELYRRLKDLQPRDGLKIVGRFYSVMDDLHIVGPGAIAAPLGTTALPDGTLPPLAKPAGAGIRTQLGLVHAELSLQGTRGPVSGEAGLDLVLPWGVDAGGNSQYLVAPRRIKLEWRTPVLMQFGDIDASLSRLTLWRNDTVDPFEPDFFAERRARMEKDLMLLPDRWRVAGFRASSDVKLLGLALSVESVTALMSLGQGSSAGKAAVLYVVPLAESASPFLTTQLGTYGNTYLEGWRMALPLGAWTLSTQGTLFWDEQATAPTPGQSFLAMNELVPSLGLAWDQGSLHARVEAALSRYQHPYLVGSPQALAGPLTGTAVTGELDWSPAQGRLRLFGRMVGSGFHAAGAQGRTVDADYQFLGPFLTENSQLGAGGTTGLMPGLINTSLASRLNDRLLPPGLVGQSGLMANDPWSNLLGYAAGEEIDPYGEATPNRLGGGAEAAWAFFGGVFKPLVSAELFQNIDPVSSTAGASLAAFTLSRYRAGAHLDLQPWLGWRLRLDGGLTLTSDGNGQQDGLGNAYLLSTSQTDVGLAWGDPQAQGLSLAYRRLEADGQDQRLAYGSSGEAWDVMAVGAWWRPTPAASLDLMASQGHISVPADPSAALEIDQLVARLTLEF